MAVTSVNVWLVGGDKVIPTSVEKAIQGDGYTVKRISGEDRYETAAKVAEAGISLSGKKPSKVFVASGVSFADALAVSPVAFAKGYPIILTEKDSTSDFSTKELGNIGTDAKILVGGEAVVSKAVAAKLSISESARVAGDDRAVTANLVSDWAKKSEGFNPANAALVGGTNGNGADSLVAASLGGKSLTTLHFAGWDATTTYLKDHSAELTGKGFVFGGPAAVTGDQVSKAQSAAQTPLAPPVAQALQLSTSAASSVTTADTVTYTVAGLKAGDLVHVDLVQSAKITNGLFTLATTNRTADLTVVTDAAIDRVNGYAVGTPAAAVSFTATGASATFRVSASAATSFVPVVYKKSDSSDATLDVNLAGSATESAGLGAKQIFTTPVSAPPAENATAAVSAKVVTSIVDGVSFTTSDTTSTGSLIMRDGDTYKLGTSVITKAQFQSILSKGDTVTVDYVANAGTSNPSTFSIGTDLFPTAAQAALTGTPTVKGKTVTLNWTADVSATKGGTDYALQRAPYVSGVTGTWTAIKSGKVDSFNEQTFTDSPADGTYVYRLVYTSPTFSGKTATSASSAAVVVPEVLAAAAPNVLRTYTTSNTSAIGNLSKGDVFKVVFDRPINAPIENAKVTVGTQTLSFKAADSTDDGASTFAVNSGVEVIDGAPIAAGRVLTITLLEDPASAVALPSALAFPASSGIGNATGAATVTATTNDTISR